MVSCGVWSGNLDIVTAHWRVLPEGGIVIRVVVGLLSALLAFLGVLELFVFNAGLLDTPVAWVLLIGGGVSCLVCIVGDLLEEGGSER